MFVSILLLNTPASHPSLDFHLHNNMMLVKFVLVKTNTDTYMHRLICWFFGKFGMIAPSSVGIAIPVMFREHRSYMPRQTEEQSPTYSVLVTYFQYSYTLSCFCLQNAI